MDQSPEDPLLSLPAHFQGVETLGQGAFGTLLRATDAQGTLVAVRLRVPPPDAPEPPCFPASLRGRPNESRPPLLHS